jgi:hypothetical protein
VAGALALFLWIESDWWRVSAGCVSNRSLVFLLVCAAITDLMFLHHVIQRPSGTVAERRDFRGRLSRINMGIVRILVFMPIGWSALKQSDRLIGNDVQGESNKLSPTLLLLDYVGTVPGGYGAFPSRSCGSASRLDEGRRRQYSYSNRG